MRIDIFGERLKAARKSKNITQLELSKHLELSKATVSAYEQSASYPSVETLVKICDTLGVSADYLLGLSDNLTFKLGGLTTEQSSSILQFIATIEKANKNIDKQ